MIFKRRKKQIIPKLKAIGTIVTLFAIKANMVFATEGGDTSIGTAEVTEATENIKRVITSIADALIISGVIKDDNMSKMFYCCKGEFSEIPHTTIYVLDSKNMEQFLKKVEC